MSDANSLNTSLLEVMISSKNEHVFICDLSDITLQIIFDACWASLNVGSKHSIAWNDCRHVPSWCFFLCNGIEETGSPGIICIVGIKFFVIHQSMGPAQCGITCWQKRTSQT